MPTQQAIRTWFDNTYSTKGLSYLRPPEFYSIFMEYLGVRPGNRVLDIGCGPGLLLGQALERGASAWGIDVSEAALAMVARQAPGAHVGVCNAEALCYPDGFFDFLTCIGVFEHALHPDQVLQEMRRVLKPGGRICLMVPNSRTLKWQIEANILGVHDEDSNERAFTFETWREILLRNGFVIEQIHPDEWPAYARRARFLGKRAGRFHMYAHRSRRLLPMRYSNQYVFILG
jgi:SAM-dependent methyltransferase